MKYRILQKGKEFKIQVFVKSFFRWKWKDVYKNYYCGDGGVHRQLALFYTLEKAQEAILEMIEEKNIERIGWKVREE